MKPPATTIGAKPCPDKQKPIAWLMLDALDAPAARELRAHLQTCAGCRGYLAELSQITTQLAAQAKLDQAKLNQASSELSASETFHRQVMARLQAEKPASVSFFAWRNIMSTLRRGVFNWQVAVPAGLAAVIILVLWIHQPPAKTTVPHAPNPVAIHALATPPIVISADDDDLQPTLANYRQAASQSLEKLDELLARQEKPATGTMPVYTAASGVLGI